MVEIWRYVENAISPKTEHLIYIFLRGRDMFGVGLQIIVLKAFTIITPLSQGLKHQISDGSSKK